jgi:hypothetical protein
MTALQMATASLAVPKSVINTMVGRAARTCGDPACSCCARALQHVAPKSAPASTAHRNVLRKHKISKTPILFIVFVGIHRPFL